MASRFADIERATNANTTTSTRRTRSHGHQDVEEDVGSVGAGGGIVVHRRGRRLGVGVVPVGVEDPATESLTSVARPRIK